MNPVVSILIISYNTCDMTLECVRSVFAETTRTPFEVIVLDNASTDGSADAIAQEFGDRVQIIRSPDNLGFAGGNNAAAEHALGEYLLLLNPDTVVLDGAIDRLMDFARERPDAKIWGGRTVYEDGSLSLGSCWGRQTLRSLLFRATGLSALLKNSSFFNPEAIGGWDRRDVRRVDIVTGCFLLIPKAFWEQLGGFNLDYFMYGEEADLCLRATRIGAKPMITPAAEIIHYGGASETVRADKLKRLLAAKALLIHHHFDGLHRPLGLALLAGWPLSRLFVHSLLSVVRSLSRGPRAVWREVWLARGNWLRGRFERS